MACSTSLGAFLDKKDRTEEEDDKMIHAAHASRYHWGEIGKPVRFERGEWQISRVYSVLKRSEPALYHAKRCLEICKQIKIGDFDIAFAYEAMARAHAAAGDKSECRKFLQLAKEAVRKSTRKKTENTSPANSKQLNARKKACSVAGVDFVCSFSGQLTTPSFKGIHQ